MTAGRLALAALAVAGSGHVACAAYSDSTLASARVPSGARAAGLGGAFTSVADDATAPYWNPAGLSQGALGVHDMLLAVSYAGLSWDRRLGFLSVTKRVPERGHFAFSLARATVGRIPLVDSSGRTTGTVSDALTTLYLTASRRTSPRLAVGANVTLHHEQLGPYRAVGAGLDLGLHWQPTFTRPYFVGACARNLGGYLSWTTARVDSAAPSLRIGHSHLFWRDRVRAAMDVELRSGSAATASAQAGLEVQLIPGVTVRAGFDSFHSAASAGASFSARQYSLDYAATRPLSGADGIEHRGALTGKF